MAAPTTHCLVLQDQVPSSEEETVSYSHNNTQAQILNNVNAVWDNGLFITFGLLPNVITYQMRYICSGKYSRFNLVSLSYKLGPSGSFGILLLGQWPAQGIYASAPEGKKFSEHFPPQLRLPDLHLAEQCDSFETTGSNYAAHQRLGVQNSQQSSLVSLKPFPQTVAGIPVFGSFGFGCYVNMVSKRHSSGAGTTGAWGWHRYLFLITGFYGGGIE
ncbi:hypothetical protein B0H14DRAFT_2605187 [Mycena olivaceomarginata]|nr:hypothetical protein B0H14DRAFT_2605187 [Mycena olivaceomarginata]